MAFTKANSVRILPIIFYRSLMLLMPLCDLFLIRISFIVFACRQRMAANRCNVLLSLLMALKLLFKGNLIAVWEKRFPQDYFPIRRRLLDIHTFWVSVSPVYVSPHNCISTKTHHHYHLTAIYTMSIRSHPIVKN